MWLKNRAGTTSSPAGTVGIGLIGAGLYASGTFLPVLKRIKGLSLRGIATNTGLAGRHAGNKYGFEYCTTDTRELLQDPAVELVFILTRHDSHGHLVVEALRAGKHVFVEKPLAVDLDQLRSIAVAHREAADRSGRRQVAFQIEWYFLVRLMPEPVNIAQMPALEETPPVDEFRPTGVVGDYSMISAVMAAEVADEIG